MPKATITPTTPHPRAESVIQITPPRPEHRLEAALVQLNVLGTMLEREPDDDFHGRHINTMRDAAHCSVFLAVARATGRTARDCIGVMIANQTDAFRTDVPALLAEWGAYLGKTADAVRARA